MVSASLPALRPAVSIYYSTALRLPVPSSSVITAVILSKVDYCNFAQFALSGLSKCDRLQSSVRR